MPNESKSSELSDPIPQNGIPLHPKKIEWKEYKLGEVAEIVGGGTPSTTNKDYWDGDIPWLSPRDLTGYNRVYIEKGARNITREGLKNSSTRLLPTGTVLFSSRAPIGYVAIAQNEICTNQGFKSLVCNPDKLWNVFAYYWLRANTEYLQSLGTGTTFAEISGSVMKSIAVSLPPLSEQKRIASILSSLDDKIDLLHRENATLEAMAEILFRHHFIENPNPEWKEGEVSIYADHYKVSLNPKKSPKSVFSHYSIPAFDQGKTPSMETGESIQSNKYSIPGDCILFSKLNPHRDKRVWMIEGDLPDNPVCSTEFQIVFPKEKEYLFFLYGWLTNKENYSEIASGVGGTSGSHQRIDPKAIFSFSCPLVDANYLREYNNMISPLFLKQRNNQEQIFNLTKQRNILLIEFLSEKARS